MSPLDPLFARAIDHVFLRDDSTVLVPIDLPLDRLSPIGTESLPPVELLRTTDLVHIVFRFVNLDLTTDASPRLTRKIASRPAYLVAQFGAQHLLEQAFFDSAGNVAPTDPPPVLPPKPSESVPLPVQAILSGASRLVFRVTDQQISFSEAGLLDAMRSLPLSVAPHAETFLDLLPWWVVATDVHALAPVARVSRTLNRSAARIAPTVAARRALTDLAGRGRLQRSALYVEAAYGPWSAVAAVTDRIDDINILTPLPRIPRTPPVPRAPSSTETAIELPWRLQLSPHAKGAFAHSTSEVSHSERVELWHTRLGTRADDLTINETDPVARTVRAIWTRDFDRAGGTIPVKLGDIPPELPGGDPFLSPLTSRDRKMIVHQSSNFALKGMPPLWSPRAARVNNLMLTTLGGWLDSEAKFPITAGALSLQEWTHRATMGRDQFVKVVYSGILHPFGHRASLIKITERRVPEGGTHAILFQRLFIIVRQPERLFRVSSNASLNNRMPFSWVRILTESTPPLMDPGNGLLPSKLNGQMFVPHVASDSASPNAAGGTPFHFRMLASDVDNHLIEFNGPLVFIEESIVDVASPQPNLDKANATNIEYDMRGQRIAFASPDEPDDTTLSTRTIIFDAERDPVKRPNYILPVLRVTKAIVPAMSAFTGQNDPVALSYPTAFAANGFDASKNWSALFLQLADAQGNEAANPAVLGFATKSDRSGGFVSPSVGMKALARRVGPVGGDLASLTTNKAAFSVGSMFPADAAKLFGVLSLADLLTNGPMPAFVTQAVTAVVSLQENIARAQAFVQAHIAVFEARSAAVGTAANDLATHAAAFPAALALVAKEPHPTDQVTTLLTAMAADLTALMVPFDDTVSPLPFARPTLEQMRALLGAVRSAAATAAATATMIAQFYQGVALPEIVTARLDWEIKLKSWPATFPLFVPKPGGSGMLRLVSEIQVPTGGGTPSALISCALPPFGIMLMGKDPFVGINVSVMEFSVRPGSKPDVNVELDEGNGIQFLGPLAFVETLKDIIPFDGFSDPPFLDVSTAGIRAGFDLALPDVPMGIFALSNIHLGAELVVPFIGESMEFRFFFATREDPFRLQVSLFAGGGFFAITVSPKGLKIIEASFEFGAAVAMSFVVASGSLSVMAGIYFKLELKGTTQSVQLTGYFRARGEVDVLGLISASIELYLELSYFNDGGKAKAIGKASISIEVSVCFLSFSVSVSCEKKLAGSAGDPTFVDMMGPYTDHRQRALDPWLDYCQAFAPEGV